MVAVVAAFVATFLFKVFAKIMKQHFSPTGRGFCETYHLLHKQTVDFLFGHGFSAHQLFELVHVIIAVKSHASSFAAVSSRTTRLLIVTFERFGHVMMNNETDIGFINPHPEGDRGHDNLHVFH